MTNHGKDHQDVPDDTKQDEDTENHAQNHRFDRVELRGQNMAAVRAVQCYRRRGHVVQNGNHQHQFCPDT